VVDLPLKIKEGCEREQKAVAGLALRHTKRVEKTATKTMVANND
jgi:hypothetical protein